MLEGHVHTYVGLGKGKECSEWHSQTPKGDHRRILRRPAEALVHGVVLS